MTKSLSLDNIYNIKEELDLIMEEKGDISLETGEDERRIFKLINEIFIIKACVDNDIIRLSHDNVDINSIIDELKNINPIFKEVYELGKCYDFNFSQVFIKKVTSLIFSYNYKNINFDFIGKIYQFYIKNDDKKKYGQFYTAESIIDEILDNLGINESNPDILNARFLDPACGTGSFLTRIVNRIINMAYKNGLSANSIIEIIKSNIYGMDIKDFSVYIAKSNLLVQLLPIIKESHKVEVSFSLYITDSLRNLTNDIEYEEEQAVIELKQVKGIYSQGFDYIVGNPPYFKATNLTKQQKQFFKDILKGQQNTYGLFLYLCIKLLRRGGKLGVIIPESIKSGLYFLALRRYIFNNCTITNIVSFDCRKTNFYNALQGVMIICLIKELNEDKNKMIEIKNVINKELLKNKKFNNKILVKYKDVVRSIRNYDILLVCTEKKYYSLINKAYKNCRYFGEDSTGYEVHTGQLVWNQVKEHLFNEPINNTKKLIWANNIEQYKLNLNGNKYGEFLYALKDDDLSNIVNTGNSILVRRTSSKEQKNRISACYYDSEEEYFLENHINFIKKFKETTAVHYYYILGLLNSELLNIIMSQIACNTQISVTELNLLPLKFNQIEKVEELVSRILSGGKETNSILKDIDSLIYSTYGLRK